MWRVFWRKALVEGLRLVNSASGWLVGSLWTDALFGVADFDDWLAQATLAACLTAGACVWLVLTGEDDELQDDEHAQRGGIQFYFVTNALGFIVGWAWVMAIDHLVPVASSALGRGEMALLYALFGPGMALFLVKYQLVSTDKYRQMEADFHSGATTTRIKMGSTIQSQETQML